MKRIMMCLGVIAAVALFMSALTNPSLAADDFPSRTITMINPYAPGGSLDMNCRLMAKYLTPVLKNKPSVVVENRTGGGGVVGYTAAANAAADGYTITMLATPMIFNFLATPGVTYTEKSFAPISQLNYEPNLLMIKKGSKLDMPINELFPYLKKNSNQITMATGGRWASLHLATEVLEDAAGIKFRKVHFTGGGPAVTNLLGGHVDLLFSYYSETHMHMMPVGELRPLAIASEERSPFLPNVPTLKELGINVVVGTWRGLAAPAKTPPSVIAALEKACKDVVMNPEAVQTWRNMNLAPNFLSSQDFGRLIASDVEKYKPIIERLKKEE